MHGMRSLICVKVGHFRNVTKKDERSKNSGGIAAKVMIARMERNCFFRKRLKCLFVFLISVKSLLVITY
jgi:hypothetical protein